MVKKYVSYVALALMFTGCTKEIAFLDGDKTLKKDGTVISYEEYMKLYEDEGVVVNKPIRNKQLNLYMKNIDSTNFVSEDVIKERKARYLALKNEQNDSERVVDITKKNIFVDFFNEWKNVDYKMGGTSKKGIDCSAFTQRFYKDKLNMSISRSTLTQVKEGVKVDKSKLVLGDLVFFKTSRTARHVGIYVGNGSFMHASIKGITVTKLDKPFYKKTYWTSRRIVN